jgi:thiol-disulfide isomerase/thioredoxin
MRSGGGGRVEGHVPTCRSRFAAWAGRRAVLIVLGPLGASLALSAGCSGSTDGGMQCAVTDAGFPPGPYGTSAGGTIKNLSLRVQTGKDGVPARKTLADYRNDPSLKVLAIFGAAEWCEPCKAEQPELVQDFTAYKNAGAGVAFLVAVTQKNDQSPSDDATVKLWAMTYGIPFDLASDPDGSLGPYFDPTTFPDALIIRLCDMNIQAMWNGSIPGMVKSAVDAALQ